MSASDAVIRLVEPQARINASVVQKLEQLLVWAKEGRLTGLATAYTLEAGWTGQGWSEADNSALLLGSVAVLHTRLAQGLADNSQAPPELQ